MFLITVRLFRKHPELFAAIRTLEDPRAEVCQVRDEENVKFSIDPHMENWITSAPVSFS